MITAIDSNVILDVLGADPMHGPGSLRALGDELRQVDELQELLRPDVHHVPARPHAHSLLRAHEKACCHSSSFVGGLDPGALERRWAKGLSET